MLNSTPSTPFSAAKAAFQPLLDALYHGREAEVNARLREPLAGFVRAKSLFEARPLP